MWICAGKVNPKAGKNPKHKKQLALKLVDSQDLCRFLREGSEPAGFSCVWISLFLASTFFFFFPFKIWIRIAVVYNSSPKSRHQRMWLAAMKPLAAHTEHTAGCWAGRRTEVRPSCPVTVTIPLSACSEQNKVDLLEVMTPSFPQRALCLQNAFSPSATWNFKLLWLLSLWVQLLTETHLATQCSSALSNNIFHTGLGWEMLQHPSELTSTFKSICTGFLLSTLKQKKVKLFFERTTWMWNDQANKKN